MRARCRPHDTEGCSNLHDGRIEQLEQLDGRSGAGAPDQIEALSEPRSTLGGVLPAGDDAEGLAEILLVQTPNHAVRSWPAVVAADQQARRALADGIRFDRRREPTTAPSHQTASARITSASRRPRLPAAARYVACSQAPRAPCRSGPSPSRPQAPRGTARRRPRRPPTDPAGAVERGAILSRSVNHRAGTTRIRPIFPDRAQR